LCFVVWLAAGGGSASNDAGSTNEQSKPPTSTKPPTPSKPAPGPTQADKAAIDRWLKENLADPNYEIVMWYGPADSKPIDWSDKRLTGIEDTHQATLAAIKKTLGAKVDDAALNAGYGGATWRKAQHELNAATSAAVAKRYADIKVAVGKLKAEKSRWPWNQAGPHAIGLKYRCNHGLLGKTLEHRVFEIKDGDAMGYAGPLWDGSEHPGLVHLDDTGHVIVLEGLPLGWHTFLH
jgi:hypothetical protein